MTKPGGPGASVRPDPLRPDPLLPDPLLSDPLLSDPLLIVPWYVDPVAHAAAWGRLSAIRERVFGAVVNVHNGPGEALDRCYREVIGGAQGPLPPLIGYLDLDYGRADRDHLRRQAQRWREWYGVAAVMLDQSPTAVEEDQRWRQTIASLRADGASAVVVNPGTWPVLTEQLAVADLTCVFEGPASDYLRWAPPHGHAEWSARCWHLVYDAAPGTPHDVPAVAERAQLLRPGALWASPDSLPHPWDAALELGESTLFGRQVPKPHRSS